MVEQANKIYGRNYNSVTSREQRFGTALVFKGIGIETTVLEREFEFHIKRELESRRKHKEEN